VGLSSLVVTDGTTPPAPAFYAQPRLLRRTRPREWWTLLHPPYTLWHLSYVVIGACLMVPVNATRLIATLLAFFLAVGLGAHALDELHGRPLTTTIPQGQLVAVAVMGIAGAVALGVAGLFIVSWYLAIFIVLGVALAVGYNLELFGGTLHTDLLFALAWGGFPVLTAGFAQHGTLSVALVAAALFATLLSQAQRQLSTPARQLRRRTTSVDGTVTATDGTTTPLSVEGLLTPLEAALRTLGWSTVVLAIVLVFSSRLVTW
jgi:hypothetical protein